jgi:pimeloyl-ACP methyl ester carboxylesterase
MAKKGSEEAGVRIGDRDASLIGWQERDQELRLHDSPWGKSLRGGWEPIEKPDRYFTRKLRVTGDTPRDLTETMVRFPSAPIYGINRKAEYNIELPRRANLHTMRILTAGSKRGPVTRLFVLHNGLNETTNLRFYYRLASWILNEDGKADNSACLIAPFPGHLMHAPFAGPFGQTPLARYLSDSGELFRQFLRYMVEMRWLLSLLSRRRPESWRVGGEPIRRSELASKLFGEWSSLREASEGVWRSRRPGDEWNAEIERRLLGIPIDQLEVRSMIQVMVEVLGLERHGSPPTLPVHVVGYSLGGFLAQSVFFAWPNLVSSCSTICSGGAIRALSPTAFANSEEWQAVLHTLKPELADSMLGRRIARDHQDLIAGMPQEQFGYYQRVFDQVFLQEDNATYKARLSEYGSRMLFVSGGEDPIVKTTEILDAAPQEGITMLSVAGLTHFLGEEPLKDREVEQREFWLPEAGGLIGRAATRAQELHAEEKREARREYKAATNMSVAEAEKVLREGDGPKPPRKRDLRTPDFESALDWVIDGVTSDGPKRRGDGWLFVSRSGPPAAFLNTDMHRAWGAGLHHHDVSVQKYVAGLAMRAKLLDRIENRTTLILPDGMKRTFVESSSGLVDPHSDAPGYLTTEAQRETAWNQFITDWGDRTRWLDAGPVGEGRLEDSHGQEVQKDFAEAVSKWQRVPAGHLSVGHLSDLWISLDNMSPGFDSRRPNESIAQFITWVAQILMEQGPMPRQPAGPIEPRGKEGEQLKADLKVGKVRIVRVSGAELNPRYRGRFEQKFWPAILLLAHCAAALVRSTDQPASPEREVAPA